MDDQTESPSREAIKAEAELQRTARRFTAGDVGIDAYLEKLSNYLFALQQALKIAKGPTFVVIDYRTQKRLDSMTEHFEKQVTERVNEECDEVELSFERDFGPARSTKISVANK